MSTFDRFIPLGWHTAAHARLRVVGEEPAGLITLSEELVTSLEPSAHVTRVISAIDFTDDEALFVAEQLFAAVEWRKGRPVHGWRPNLNQTGRI